MISTLDNESHFGLGRSLLSPTQLVATAYEQGYDAVAITDLMSINGMVEFSKALPELEIKKIIGCKLRVYLAVDNDPKGKCEEAMFNVYAKNEKGMQQIMALLTVANNTSAGHFYYKPRVPADVFYAAIGSDDITAIACIEQSPLRARIHAKLAKAACDSGLLKFQITQNKTPLHMQLNKLHAGMGVDNLITCQTARYKEKEDATAYDTMVGIIDNVTIGNGRFKRPYNRNQTPVGIISSIHDHSSSVGVDNAGEIAKVCDYKWEPMPISLPEITDDEDGMMDDILEVGWHERFSYGVMGHKPSVKDLGTVYRERLAYERGVLQKMGFQRYFLIVADLVKWSKAQGIMVGPGRGSVGGSLIAYLMGITDVDPIRYGLIFERFINPERLDLPDADLDFASSRRHEVIEYLRDKYGIDNCAGISNYVGLGPASAVRDTGRIHGMSPIELIATKQIPAIGVSLDEARESIPDVGTFADQNPIVWNEAKRLQGTIRNMGQHAAGIVVTEDKDGMRLADRCVLEKRGDSHVANWDRMSVEDWGLVKIDILGLSTLDAIGMTVDMVDKISATPISLLTIPLNDPATMENFGDGNTIGVFQFESRGMRGVLKSLAEGGELTFEDLYTTTALYRPGPMQSGMLDQYVNIRKGIERPFYEHPAMEPVLSETLGHAIFQEQIMEMAKQLAGYSMAEADKLRKIMGKKQIAEMELQRDKFLAGCMAGRIKIEMEDGTIREVHALEKILCTDGKSRTAQEIMDGGFDVS